MVDTDVVMLAIGRLEGKMDAALMRMDQQDKRLCDLEDVQHEQNVKFQTFKTKVLTVAGVISTIAGGAASSLWTLLK